MIQPINKHKLSEPKQQAIEWLVRLRSDDMNNDELNALAEWLAQDITHSVAFAEAEKLFDEMSLAAKLSTLDEADDTSASKDQTHISSQPSAQQKGRRIHNPQSQFVRWLVPPISIAAVWWFAVLLIFSPNQHLLDKWISDYHTQTGELLEVSLSDGSRILLDTNSAVSVDYDDNDRRIRLHHGQVRFTVARESTRPFDVVVNGLKVRTLGTIFQIAHTDDLSVKVAVQEHAVAASLESVKIAHSSKKMGVVTIQTGQQLIYQSGSSLSQPEDIPLDRITAWQQQRLVINDQPLNDLITELERYRNGRILIPDEKLKSMHITGVFSLDNPEGVLESVCQILNLQKTRLGPWWVVLHQKSTSS